MAKKKKKRPPFQICSECLNDLEVVYKARDGEEEPYIALVRCPTCKTIRYKAKDWVDE